MSEKDPPKKTNTKALHSLFFAYLTPLTNCGHISGTAVNSGACEGKSRGTTAPERPK